MACKKSIFIILWAFFVMQVFAQNNRELRNKEQSQENNNACFKCHALETVNTDSGEIHLREKYIVDTTVYYSSIHGGFNCTDCHSEDYNTQPHKVTIKDDVFPACMDCHEGNKKTASYHFEEIAKAYDKSVHAKKMKDDFNCWKCHDPHGYVNLLGIVDSIGLWGMIVGQNQMCLKCHGTEIYSGLKHDIIKVHSWLPQTELHFQHVRCIDCHAVVPENIHISHNIMSAGQAIRNCLACHSANSQLLQTLYKYQRSLKHRSYGFMNGEILQNSYVMGANRNRFLNIASVVIFGLIIFTILVHFLLRISTRKK